MAIEKLSSAEVAAIQNMLDWIEGVTNPSLRNVLIEVLVDTVIRLREIPRE